MPSVGSDRSSNPTELLALGVSKGERSEWKDGFHSLGLHTLGRYNLLHGGESDTAIAITWFDIKMY